jgi:lipid-A-disaccharide synthase
LSVKKIAIVCAEPSGDMLASGLIKKLKLTYPDAKICGIGGELSQQAGLDSWFDMNELSVMGLVEVLKHLPRLLSIKRALLKKLFAFEPDIFIGVDAPDFNLPIEAKLKAKGVTTVHYVSPTVWAWREGRMAKIKRAADHVLGLFPFEAQVYQRHEVDYTFIGHPMADAIGINEVRHDHCLSIKAEIEPLTLALLPGSRAAEVATLLPTFLDSVLLLQEHIPDLQVLIPAANQARFAQIQSILANHTVDKAHIQVLTEPARTVMLASHCVLLSSGTATLEAMLCRKPMIAAYTMSALTYWMMRRLYKPDFFALPNILADELLVPEVLQKDVNPVMLSAYLLHVLAQYTQQHPTRSSLSVQCSIPETICEGSKTIPATTEHFMHVQKRFADCHHTLRKNADQQAHNVIVSLLEKSKR